MTNPTVNLVDLDFNGIKNSLKTYLKAQDRFKDYDFEGSNFAVLLDVLAYNTYLNSFYLNMVASEMFLDTAQLKDSIISHAKELNYVPRSFRSSQALVNISITPASSTSSVVIPLGTGFTARVGSNTFNFVTSESLAITTSNNGVFYANNVTLYQGSYVTDTFTKNDSIDNQRFVLSNPNIDTSSIRISVTENNGANVEVYTQAFSLFGHTSTSKIFFVQPAENEQYEIIFGDDTIGRKPVDQAIVDVEYRISSGELSNGADNFINNANIDGHSNVSITLVSSAINGNVSENVDSVKFNATRNFQAQERAVTEEDYRTLLLRQFPEIQAISVYGGEKVDPPQYGKVFCAIDITNADGLPEVNKNIYRTYLKDKIPLSVVVEFADPEFIYLNVVTNVRFNVNVTTLSENEIRSKILSAITDFNDSVINDFNSEFNYSNFVAAIDNSDQSIINNFTTVNPFIKIVPTVNFNNSYVLNFYNEILKTSPEGSTHPVDTDKGVFSSNFTFGGFNCILEDDGLGNLRIAKDDTITQTEVKKIGTVDYVTGVITITDFNPTAFTGDGVDLFIKTKSSDITSSQKSIMTINPRDITVNITPVRR
jgi:hypothetical protein